MEESKIKKLMFNEVSLIVAICGGVLSMFIFLTGLPDDNNVAIQLQQQRITAQEETIATITQTQQNDTKEVKSEIQGLRDEIQTLTNCIVKLETIINERIPKE